MATRRLPVVGVMGSGRFADSRAAALGDLLARMGVHLLTGGGRGAMEAVARAFVAVEDRRGLALGVLPGDGDGTAPEGYPNPFVELAIRTHLPARGREGDSERSRNHINVLSSDAVVALPGEAGTLSEVRLALRYGRPVAAFLNAGDEIPGLPENVPVLDNVDQVKRFLGGVLNTE